MNTDMPVCIRKGGREDLEALHALVRELAAYEKAGHEVMTSPDIFLQDWQGGWFEFLVAEETDSGAITGIALYHRAYSTWKGRMIYLDDLVVSEDHRRKGIGDLLLDAMIAEARTTGAALLKWQVLDWNEPALSFYRKRPVVLDHEWINCKYFLD